jgi:hypothetical protein
MEPFKPVAAVALTVAPQTPRQPKPVLINPSHCRRLNHGTIQGLDEPLAARWVIACKARGGVEQPHDPSYDRGADCPTYPASHHPRHVRSLHAERVGGATLRASQFHDSSDQFHECPWIRHSPFRTLSSGGNTRHHKSLF